MPIRPIHPANAPEPRGPYSPAVQAGEFVYVSGQVPVDPATGKMDTGDVRHQTHLVLSNVKAILAGAGATPSDVVRCGVFLRDPGDFAAMNEVYSGFFGDHKPARTTVAAQLMSPEIRVEIDCVAFVPRKS